MSEKKRPRAEGRCGEDDPITGSSQDIVIPCKKRPRHEAARQPEEKRNQSQKDALVCPKPTTFHAPASRGPMIPKGPEQGPGKWGAGEVVVQAINVNTEIQTSPNWSSAGGGQWAQQMIKNVRGHAETARRP